MLSLAPALTCSLLPWSLAAFWRRLSLLCPRHLLRLACALALSLSLPSWCFSTTLLLCQGFGTRDGRGSGMCYFRALAYVPPHPTPRLGAWKRLDRPAPSRPRHSGLRTAGPLRPPRLARRRNPWSLQRASAGAAALPEAAARGRAPGAGLELLSSAGRAGEVLFKEVGCWPASGGCLV